MIFWAIIPILNNFFVSFAGMTAATKIL